MDMGERIDYESVVAKIETAGAVVNSVDQIVVGDKIVE